MSILEDLTIESGRALFQQGGSFKNIAATTSGSATLSLVKSGAGFLHAVIINTTAAGAVTVYDSLTQTGTKVGILKASIVEGSYVYNIKFSTGLTVVTAGSTDLTVSYR